MKTHQEIRDAIEALVATCSPGSYGDIESQILNALNDRIESLYKLCFERAMQTRNITANLGIDVAALENRLEEIHPTISKMRDATDSPDSTLPPSAQAAEG